MSRSPPPPGPKSCFPSHTPVTSTVTSVRSIQSCFAQPESIASVAAMRTTARDFIHHRGGEAGGEDGSTRRRYNRSGIPIVARPFISSPLTVNSPSAVPFVCLKRNTSPATVPSMGPGLNPNGFWLAPNIIRIDPFTVDPCCSRSNTTSREPTPPPPPNPCQVPVTSIVTSVRSIQSCLAHPRQIASEIARSSLAPILMLSPQSDWGRRPAIDASRSSRRDNSVDPPQAICHRSGASHALAGHLDSANRQLPGERSPQVLKRELVARHAALDRRGPAWPRDDQLMAKQPCHVPPLLF